MSEEIPEGIWESIEQMGIPMEHVLMPQQVKRRILRDLVPCDMTGDVMRAMQISPASEEIEDIEHQDGHDRAIAAAGTFPYIHSFSHDCASVLTATVAVANGLTPADLGESEERLQTFIEASARAIVSELVDLGILHTPHYMSIDGEDDET